MQFDTRVDVERVLAQDLGALRGRAVADLVAATEGLLRWADRVRDPHAPYRFRWAVESLRAADVASTSYILNRLVDAGAIDRVLTPQQQRDGTALESVPWRRLPRATRIRRCWPTSRRSGMTRPNRGRPRRRTRRR